jgi:hypothetical protein
MEAHHSRDPLRLSRLIPHVGRLMQDQPETRLIKTSGADADRGRRRGEPLRHLGVHIHYSTRLSVVDFDVRACRPSEATAVLELWEQTRSEHASMPDRLDDVQRLLSHDAGSLLVAGADSAILGALIAASDGWRGNLTGEDPREELAFQNQLADYAQVLRQQGGGVTKTWKPGAPPDQWAKP